MQPTCQAESLKAHFIDIQVAKTATAVKYAQSNFSGHGLWQQIRLYIKLIDEEFKIITSGKQAETVGLSMAYAAHGSVTQSVTGKLFSLLTGKLNSLLFH